LPGTCEALGIAGICPGPNLSRRAHQAAIYPYLLREVKASSPNHIWGLDITSIRLVHGWMYLVVVLDWYSRYIISWELNQSLHLSFVLDALDGALAQAHPVICTSDQGSHFTSQEYLGRLQAANVQISMDGKGRALDNVFTERVWRTIKYEEVYLNEYATPREARHGLSRYIQFYNQARPHQALQYQTPAEVYYMKKGSSTLSSPILVS
jgi:putative transposase